MQTVTCFLCLLKQLLKDPPYIPQVSINPSGGSCTEDSTLTQTFIEYLFPSVDSYALEQLQSTLFSEVNFKVIFFPPKLLDTQFD